MADPRPEPSAPVDTEEMAAGRAAAAYINGLIRGPAGPTQPRAPVHQRRRGRERLARMRRFLDALGHPQAGLPVVLVAGTSGKGSVAVKIAEGLRAAGYATGLHVTPYLQTPLEKFWLDGRLARPGELADLAAWIRPVVERADPRQPPTYGMVWVALTFEYFRRARVDALVLEVGAGGRFDLTNVCDPLLNVITTVGMDHEKSLGPKLADIAWHKAGIARPGVPTVVGGMPAPARAVVIDEVHRAGATLIEAGPTAPDDFRATNDRLAEAVLDALSARGFARIDAAAREAARGSALPGRYERMPSPDGPAVILDGAHNPDKARALADLWRRECSPHAGVLVAGTVGYRSPAAVLAPLWPTVQAWIATEPQVLGKPPTPAAAAAQAGSDAGYPAVAAEPDPLRALDRALEICPPGGRVLVAGSLYLAGNIRPRWYPTEEIERQRTMWPLRHTAPDHA
ncbi:MAG: hypothetical protein OXG43_12205 [Chloroflexi bacterium]|nr:hypothetical protein [Chloroflexota bacterium]